MGDTIIEAPVGCVVCGAAAEAWVGTWPYCLAHKPTRTIIQSDWFNALYEDGVLVIDGKPDRVNVETLAREHPDAPIHFVDDDLYDDVLDGAGYPQRLADFPLDRTRKIR